MTSNADIARAMAENMAKAAVPLYGKKMRLPDRGAIIGIIKEFRRLLFPAYFGDPQLMALPAENYAALLLERIETALTAQVADSPEFPCTSEIAFGELVFGDREWGRGDSYGLEQSSLELDGDYDVAALGAEAGRFVLYADDEEVSVERAAELLLEVRRVMEESGVPFRSVDFVLRCPRVEAGGPRTGEESIHVLNFPWEEIREEGMKERVQAAYEESMAYYAREDAKKQAG